MASKDFLVEIGTEELPPKALNNLSLSFQKGILSGLEQKQLSYGASQYFASPRRLAVYIDGIPEQLDEQRQERRGPALSAAFDTAGRPTKAAVGFARSCGVTVDQLQTLKTEKGEWLSYHQILPAVPTPSLLPDIVNKALSQLPIPKRMRWGDHDDEFVRPAHWCLMLFGDELVPATLLGLSASDVSYGHRFHHPESIKIPEAKHYARILHNSGYVIANFSERRSHIQQQIQQLITQAHSKAIIDPALLDEVTALVEWPVAILGHFDDKFLDIPAEVLMSAMQDHQKYFPVVDAE